jgi:putative ABC transport system permease protein
VLKPAVTPSYFAVMGIPIRQGRGFLASDVRGAARVAVVSESLARRFWPGRSPIGERLTMRDRPTAGDWITIVGVVADVAQNGASGPRVEAIYQAIAQMEETFWLNHLTFVVRDTLAERMVIPAIRQAVHAVDRDQPIGAIFSMDQRISDAVAEPRFRSTVLVVFSALALALAMIGVYGVLAYAVAERTREIGIRMALGAAPAAVLRLVMTSAARLAIPGLAIGLVLSVVATRVLGGVLYGVTPTDPATLFGASAALLAVALLAGLGPALRASRIDPAITIK